MDTFCMKVFIDYIFSDYIYLYIEHIQLFTQHIDLDKIWNEDAKSKHAKNCCANDLFSYCSYFLNKLILYKIDHTFSRRFFISVERLKWANLDQVFCS